MRSNTTWVAVVAVAWLGVARAEPVTPGSDDEVLLVLPRALGPRQEAELQRLERYHRTSPADAVAAEDLARLYVGLGRRDGDPRFYGMAQAAISAWNKSDAPLGIIELRAEIWGFGHDFAAALEDYGLVLARDPERRTARLARAVLLTVVGRTEAASADCEKLPGDTQEGVVCRMNVALSRKDAPEALALYGRQPEVGAWGLETAAEAAALAGDAAVAESLFRKSLVRDDRAFTRAAFGDFLIAQGRPRDALEVLPRDARNLAVVVRRAAALAAATPDAQELKELTQALADAFALERERGDPVHGREYALYLLKVRVSPAEALIAARANWDKQKEPVDARLLAEAEAKAVAR